MSVKVILADDHKMIREGLSALLQSEADVEVVAEAQDGATAVKLAREHKPDVMIMDIVMPDLNGIDATRQIMEFAPETKIIALSMHTEKRFVTEMLEAGASGYLLKDSAFEELIRAINVVLEGKTYLSPEISGVLVQDYRRKGGAPDGRSAQAALSAREREVLRLLAEGKSTKGIAAQLEVSVKTIETHRHRIMHKLGIHNVAELT
ncbi:response regulator transcription factor, partial [bacterium]|nr:response regulator transcription factor [bacterium]